MTIEIEVYDVTVVIFRNPSKETIRDLLNDLKDGHRLGFDLRIIESEGGLDILGKQVQFLATSSKRVSIFHRAKDWFLVPKQLQFSEMEYVSILGAWRLDHDETLILPKRFTFSHEETMGLIVDIAHDRLSLEDGYEWRKLPGTLASMDFETKRQIDIELISQEPPFNIHNEMLRFDNEPHYGWEVVREPTEPIVSQWVDKLDNENNPVLGFTNKINGSLFKLALWTAGENRIDMYMDRNDWVTKLSSMPEHFFYGVNIIDPNFNGDPDDVDEFWSTLPDPIIFDDMENHGIEGALLTGKCTAEPRLIPEAFTVEKSLAKEVAIAFAVYSKLRSDLKWFGDKRIFDF